MGSQEHLKYMDENNILTLGSFAWHDWFFMSTATLYLYTIVYVYCINSSVYLTKYMVGANIIPFTIFPFNAIFLTAAQHTAPLTICTSHAEGKFVRTLVRTFVRIFVVIRGLFWHLVSKVRLPVGFDT